MGRALDEARKALKRGEVPVGAVLVSGDQIIARGYNQSCVTKDPTAHAEIVALRKAARRVGNYRLNSLTLLVTVEPCPMCLGAILQARLKRLVYGTEDPKAGAVVSRLKFSMNKANHHPEIVRGIREDECRQLLKDFFKQKREKRKEQKIKSVENISRLK